MTKTEKLQSVEQRIRKLVPRLQELSFGCMLKTPTNKIVTFSHSVAHAASKKKVKDYDGSIFTTPTKEYTDYICIKKNGSLYHYGLFGEDKIIGHTIDLEAVLEALGQFSTPNNNAKGKNYAYSCIKGFLEFQHVGGINSFNRRDYIRLAVYWQYGKPLSEQSDELIDFLFNLFNPHDQD